MSDGPTGTHHGAGRPMTEVAPMAPGRDGRAVVRRGGDRHTTARTERAQSSGSYRVGMRSGSRLNMGNFGLARAR